MSRKLLHRQNVFCVFLYFAQIHLITLIELCKQFKTSYHRDIVHLRLKTQETFHFGLFVSLSLSFTHNKYCVISTVRRESLCRVKVVEYRAAS